MITIKDVRKSIKNVKAMRHSHVFWAEYFEANPDVEKEYVATGEWDNAKEHRNLIDQYDKILDILKSFIHLM